MSSVLAACFSGLSALAPSAGSRFSFATEKLGPPAAYGDFVAGVLAIIAVLALAHPAPWALIAVWVFNVWGIADLLFALYKAQSVNLDRGSLGAGFCIVTAIVPPLLVSHVLIFMLLLRSFVPNH